MIQVALQIAPVLAGKSWWLGTSPGPALVTGDHAPVQFTRPEARKPFLGVGLADAEEVDFPLDRYHALLMFQPSLPEKAFVMERENVLFLNGQIAASSHRFVFQHPDDPGIENIIPKRARPLFHVNQQPMFDVHTRTKIRLAPIFTPFFVRGHPDDMQMPTEPFS